MLASQAFQVIDADGDGWATLSDLEHFFHSDAKTLELDGLLPRGKFDVHTFHACLRGEDVSISSSSSDNEDAQCFCHFGREKNRFAADADGG